MGDAQRGFTLVEVLAASLIASVVAGGTLMAFATAARISHQQSSTAAAEATGYAQRFLEGIRNKVQQDPDPVTGKTWLEANADLSLSNVLSNGWIDAPITDPAGGTDSIRQNNGAKRCYRVRKEVSCHNTTGPDCYAVNVAVCWDKLDQPRPCPCP